MKQKIINLFNSLKSVMKGNVSIKKSKKILKDTGYMLLTILLLFTPVVSEYLATINTSPGLIFALTTSWIVFAGWLALVIKIAFGVPDVPEIIKDIKEGIDEVREKTLGN